MNYIAFAFPDYYPAGGLADIVAMTQTFDDAVAALNDKGRADTAYIVEVDIVRDSRGVNWDWASEFGSVHVGTWKSGGWEFREYESVEKAAEVESVMFWPWRPEAKSRQEV